MDKEPSQHQPRSGLPRLAIEVTARREARGLSQGELALRLGVDPATVSRWEKGRYRLKGAPLLARLREALDFEQRELDRLFVDWHEREQAERRYRIQGVDYLEDAGLDEDALLDILIAMDVADTPQFDTAEVIGDAGMWAELFRRAPHSWRLLTLEGAVGQESEIAGYWHCLTLRPEVVARLAAGEMDESALEPDMLELPVTSLEPRPYSMWLASLFVAKRHFSPATANRLVRSLVHELESQAASGFFYSEIVTAAFTPMERSTYRSFGLSPTGGTYHLPNGETGEVYAMSGHDIGRRGACSRRPRLAALYRERFTVRGAA